MNSKPLTQKAVENFYKKLTACRVCGSKNLSKYLDLGRVPLANSLISKETDFEPKLPLQVLYCNNCSLSQLSVIVDPELLFSYYVYRSSISKTFQQHCFNLAEEVKNFFPKNVSPLVLDIASNDGCSLQEFKKLGFNVLGVEPAKNLAEIANEEGVKTINSFWSKDVAKKISLNYKVDVVTAQNVFAHVHDLKDFVEGVKLVLNKEGIFIGEIHYAGNLIKKNQFDVIYHEHLCYWLLKPLISLFEGLGLKVFNAKILPIHGGTLRFYTAFKESSYSIDSNVKKILDFEEKSGLHEVQTYYDYRKKIEKVKEDFTLLLKKLKSGKKKVAGFGASAKGNTLLNYCGIDSNFIDFIVDQTPEKLNKFYAGVHIPILEFHEIDLKKPDYIIILAWNFAKEIIEKINNSTSFYERGGKFIIPIPELKIGATLKELQ